jgi:hypothetical protein
MLLAIVGNEGNCERGAKKVYGSEIRSLKMRRNLKYHQDKGCSWGSKSW